LVQIFQSLDGPTTPSDLRVTVPGLISLTMALGRGNPLCTVSASFPTSHTSRCGIPPYPNPCSARTSSSSLPTPNPITSSQISSI
ncbi:hypothetical protein B0H19DRAFT_1202941, partial [Mycena capillaripes]